ncbi:glycoside hydrolase family 18 protein [Aquiflexum sp.]|uniref:glycoside hydrolase family 18 protein n=1 Tax=Aquiflexum sp. TaxID=1872584 RepID=UPI0035942E74
MNKTLFTALIGLVWIGISCQPKNKSQTLESSESASYKVIGYIAGWKGVDLEKIHADKLTHINYAFANVVDGVVIEGEGRAEQDKENLSKLRSLKSINPDLKILISIGGWTWSGGFSDAVLTDESRKRFTDSAIDYLIRHDLDGLDFDWEYPGLPGDDNIFRSEDKENFVFMLKSVREALDSLGTLNNTHYLSTIASAGFNEYLDVNDMAEAQKYLDFINIMTYDFIVQGNKPTGHHTNLYAEGREARSAENAVLDHVDAGIPIGKLVMGMAFYGRSWVEVNPENNGLYQMGKAGKGFPFSAIEGLIASGDYVRYWDDASKAPYLWNASEKIFVTYEDPESIFNKIQFIKKHNMGGAMFWEYNEDSDERTLLNAIDKGFNNP